MASASTRFEDDRKQLAAGRQAPSIRRSGARAGARSWSPAATSAAGRRASTRRRRYALGPRSTGDIGESFAEIFFGNCVALGIPCLTAAADDLAKLSAAVQADPALEVTVDLIAQQVRFGTSSIAATMPDGPREQLVSGRWDTTGELLEGARSIEKTAAALPYLAGFR